MCVSLFFLHFFYSLLFSPFIWLLFFFSFSFVYFLVLLYLQFVLFYLIVFSLCISISLFVTFFSLICSLLLPSFSFFYFSLLSLHMNILAILIISGSRLYTLIKYSITELKKFSLFSQEEPISQATEFNTDRSNNTNFESPAQRS
jgi:hypothetical protein